MKKVSLSWLLPILLVIGGAIIFFGTFSKAESATATHIVISEVQIAGATAGDEFVELYNPTSSSADLTGWRLRRKTSAGGDGGNLVSSLSGSIPAYGFFLITPQTEYTGPVSADQMYSVSGNPVAANNTVLLYSDAGVTLVDKVGIGTVADSETSPASAPSAGGSVERKANSLSDAPSMTTGDDQFAGNGEDTDDNASDFILRSTSQPQNSSSSIEPTPVPTPTNTPIPTPTVVPTEIPTPTPTIVPTAIPTPTIEPTPTLTMTPSPTLSPAPTATVTPTPTGIPVFPRFTVVCSTKILNFNFGFIHIRIPLFTCRLVRV